MNAPETIPTDRERGLYGKYIITRADGDPTGKHADDEYFVLDLTTDKHAIPAIAAYADSCADEYPALAADLRAKVAEIESAKNEFVTVPETTLPNGLFVPSFQIGKYACSKGASGRAVVTATDTPWSNINYHDAKAECENAGFKLLKESQALSIAFDIANQDINWTGGKVGEGKVYMGLHQGNVSSAQPGTYESDDPEERRWHQLSNGQRVYDIAGNIYSWIFDDIQGDENGITGKIAADSPSITTAPFPSTEKGMGWRPDGARDWSGAALVRGGCWGSGDDAGVFHLGLDWPDLRYDGVGFRCTK